MGHALGDQALSGPGMCSSVNWRRCYPHSRLPLRIQLQNAIIFQVRAQQTLPTEGQWVNILGSTGRMVSGATGLHHRGMEAAVHSTSMTRCVCVPTMKTGAGWVWPEGGSLLTLP